MSGGGAPPVRVLVVDDSAFARLVLRGVLAASPGIEVVGTAADGLEALEAIARLRPDVVTLDLLMPRLDGVGVVRAAPDDTRFVVVSITAEDSDLAVAALEAGALAIVRKPTSLATDRLYDVGDDLVREVLAVAAATPESLRRAGRAVASRAVPAAVAPLAPPPRVVVVGTSTGGPQALAALVPALPGDLPAPVAIALHIPPGYTATLARRLDAASAARVVEAEDGMPIDPGTVAIAPGGRHLTLSRDPDGGRVVAELDRGEADAPYRPSVDLLFRSAADAFGAAVLGVVLTGMGDDGCAGADAVRRAGGAIVAEAESSSVVYGMPRAVADAGLASVVLPLGQIGAAVARLVGPPARAS